jgi:phage repressor protein C with HTH and peptisase S24 domain
MENIGARLKAYREKSMVKMPEIEAVTGISKETLYKWEKGTKPRNAVEYLALKSYLDKMELSLEDERFLSENQKPATLRLPLNPNRTPRPQKSGKEAAGTIIIADNEPELIVDRINAPVLGHIEGIVEVTGESMEPTLKNGCRVVITRLEYPYTLLWGNCYFIVDHNLATYVRRIYAGNDQNSIRLLADFNDQSKYPPIELKRNQILAIFMIKASIYRL